MLEYAILFFFSGTGMASEISGDTLSLQGNVVQKPINETFHGTMDSLRDCARKCVFDKQCQMLLFQLHTKNCILVTATSDSETVKIPTRHVAYVRGVECAKDRAMRLGTRKMSFYSHEENRSTNPINIYSPQSAEWKPEDFNICCVVYVARDSPLVSFGSADGGKRLTKDSTLPNYRRYGFCVPSKGMCGANMGLFERDDGYFRSDSEELVIEYEKTESFFCFFWVGSKSQCNPAMRSDQFTYNFRMGY